MKTQRNQWSFLGYNIPLKKRGSPDLGQELRTHVRYQYAIEEASEMLLSLKTKHHGTKHYTMNIVNSSVEGYCLMLRNSDKTILQVGNHVHLQLLSEPPAAEERGEIRWIKQITPTDLVIGIHLL